MKGWAQYTIYYCKSKKKTGKPLVISNGTEEITTHKVRLCGIGSAEMEFNNAEKVAKRRGATTTLRVYGSLHGRGRGGYEICGHDN